MQDETTKIQQNLIDDNRFSNQIDRFKSGNMQKFETLSLGSTPYILFLVGAHGEELTINQSVLTNCMLNINVNRHSSAHDISTETIKELPKALRNPIVVLKGQHPGTIVAVTELKDKAQNNIIVPIALDLRGTNSIVNKVTTVYGKQNIYNYLTRHSSDIIAINTKKANALFTTIGLQLPQTTSAAIRYDDSISYSIKNVKYPGHQSKKRLFIDMNGTLCRFHDEVKYLERMWEKGFFENLKPFQEMVNGIKMYMKKNPNTEVYILSAAIEGEPPYCRAEKCAWLDKHLPQIDSEHRILTKVGKSKADYIPGGITMNDILIDDYNVGLEQWQQDGGRAIKCVNNINHKGLHGKLWEGELINNSSSPAQICAELEKITMQHTNNIKMARKMMNYGRK